MKATKVWSREDVNDGISTYIKNKVLGTSQIWAEDGEIEGPGPYLALTGLFKNSNNMDISNTALCKNSVENRRW